MRLALLGGSFDPVHAGHLSIGRDVLEAGLADLVLLVPAARNPFKSEGPCASDKDRLEMLRLATRGQPGFLVDPLELSRGGTSRTWDTVEEIEYRYRPEGPVALILGADTAATLPSWYRGTELSGRCAVIACSRGGRDLPPLDFPATRIEGRAFDVSSREIRDRIAALKPWGHLVHANVASYIRQRGLYGCQNAGPFDPLILEERLSRQMGADRLAHSRGVAEYAQLLAPRFGVDPATAWFAGLVHDAAKELPREEILSLARQYGCDIGDAERKKPGLLHAEAGAAWLASTLDIADRNILDAVAAHTGGRPGMGPLARLVYIADKLEFSRPDVDPALRAASWTMEANELFRLVVRATADWFITRGKGLYQRTIDLLDELEKESQA